MIEINFYNKMVKGNIIIREDKQIYSFKNNNIIYNNILNGNSILELYANDNIYKDNILIYNDGDLIDSFDNTNGSIKINNLDIGKYYLVKKSNLEGYINNYDKYEFEINYIDQYTRDINLEISFSNLISKGNLVIYNNYNNKGISNSLFNIYNDKDELILSRYTDKNGSINISDLPIGKYKIKQDSVNEIYQLNGEIFYVNNERIELINSDDNYTNDNNFILVENTLLNKNIINNVMNIFLVISGFGQLVYVKKKI